MKPPRKHFTLVMIVKGTELLLGFKKRGFGHGKWNGFGGKLLKGETFEDCAKRETKEECGLSLVQVEEVGRLTFEFVDDPQLLEVHVFRSDVFEGHVIESEEMKPQWFRHDAIPYDNMWADDILWYPIMLRGDKFEGFFVFDGHDKMLHHDLKIVDAL